MAELLTKMFNLSLQADIVSDAWKVANVIPVASGICYS